MSVTTTIFDCPRQQTADPDAWRAHSLQLADKLDFLLTEIRGQRLTQRNALYEGEMEANRRIPGTEEKLAQIDLDYNEAVLQAVAAFHKAQDAATIKFGHCSAFKDAAQEPS